MLLNPKISIRSGGEARALDIFKTIKCSWLYSEGAQCVAACRTQTDGQDSLNISSSLPITCLGYKICIGCRPTLMNMVVAHLILTVTPKLTHPATLKGQSVSGISLKDIIS